MTVALHSNISPKGFFQKQALSFGSGIEQFTQETPFDMSDSLSWGMRHTNNEPAGGICSVQMHWYADKGRQLALWQENIRFVAGAEEYIQGPCRGPFLLVVVNIGQQAAQKPTAGFTLHGMNHVIPFTQRFRSARPRWIKSAFRKWWRASASPAITNTDTVFNVAVNEGLGAPVVMGSYTVPLDHSLLIETVTFGIRPQTAASLGRLRLRLGSLVTGDEIWTHAMQSGPNTEGGPQLSIPVNLELESQQEFCFSGQTGATATVMDMLVTGYLKDGNIG